MEYEKIISVTGLPGLYELVSSKSDGAIVRSLEDQSTRFVSSRIHNFSHLESIEVYTNRDNVNLVDIFNAMESKSETLPDEKDNTALRNYFESVYPDLDFERVYTSDMKKMVKWFSVLKANNIEIKLKEPEEPVEEPQPEEAEPVIDKKAEKAKKAEKTEASKKADKPVKAAKEKEPAKKADKPAAKAAAKKEEKKEAPKKKAAPKAAKTEKKKEIPAKKKAAAKKKK